jgi:hypothetical protein
MAVWDALARSHETSLVRLLGGAEKPIRTYGAVGYDGVAGSARVAEEWAGRGFKGVKAKIGYADVREDLEVIRAIRAAVGEGVAIMVDYNQCLTAVEAVQRLRVLDEAGLTWVEEPTLAHDYAGHALIARESGTPVQCGENWWGMPDLRQAVDTGASDYLMLPMSERKAAAEKEADTLIKNWLSFNETEVLNWYKDESHKDATYVLASTEKGGPGVKGVTQQACLDGLGKGKNLNHDAIVTKTDHEQAMCLYNTLPWPGYSDELDTSQHTWFARKWRNKLAFETPLPTWKITDNKADPTRRIRIRDAATGKYISAPGALRTEPTCMPEPQSPRRLSNSPRWARTPILNCA